MNLPNEEGTNFIEQVYRKLVINMVLHNYVQEVKGFIDLGFVYSDT